MRMEQSIKVDLPLVSILVLNRNGKELLEICVPSILNQNYKNIEIIVIDNGSNDGSIKYLKNRFPQVKIIENKKDIGFSAANNAGIKESKGEYIFILNNDTEMDKNCVSSLVNIAEDEEYSKVGMFSPKILSYFDRNVFDNVGHLIYKDGLNRGRGKLEKDDQQYDKIEEICFPSGCAAFYRKKVFNEIGLLDEDFHYYGDDTDLGLRARMAGWISMYIPEAIVYHMYSATAGKYSPIKAFLVERNRLWVAIKIFPISLLIFNPYYSSKRYLYQIYGVLGKKGSAGKYIENYSAGSLFLILLKAWYFGLRGLPKMLKKRKIIQKNKKVSNKEIYSWFKRFGISAKELTLKE